MAINLQVVEMRSARYTYLRYGMHGLASGPSILIAYPYVTPLPDSVKRVPKLPNHSVPRFRIAPDSLAGDEQGQSGWRLTRSRQFLRRSVEDIN